MQIRSRAAIAASLLGALALSACSPGGASESSDENTIHIVGFAVPEAANKAIAEEFVKTDEGEDVKFKTSYGASGDQSRAVAAGLEADYVHFSVPTDVTRLVDAGLVADDWDAGENKGVVSTSVVVFGVRDGNPKNIDDLGRPDQARRRDRHAEPRVVGRRPLERPGGLRARSSSDGGTEEEATEYVNKLFKNVVSLPSSGRDATTAFLGGTGDVLMAYENEAILAAPERRGLRVHHPGDHPEDREPGRRPRWRPSRAVAGLAGLRPQRRGPDPVRPQGLPSAPRRRRLRRSVEGATDPSNPFPTVPNLLTVDDDFGSWSELSTKFFDEENGIDHRGHPRRSGKRSSDQTTSHRDRTRPTGERLRAGRARAPRSHVLRASGSASR